MKKKKSTNIIYRIDPEVMEDQSQSYSTIKNKKQEYLLLS